MGRRAVVVAALALAAVLPACAAKDATALPPDLAGALARSRPAAAPFAHFTVARLALHGRCRSLLVADTEDERVEGLRAVRTLAPYDGMVFVFDRPTHARFTMADTLVPLDIAFLDDRGRLLRGLTMRPCPRGTDATCPVYDPKVSFRFAVETPAGAAGPVGGLTACA